MLTTAANDLHPICHMICHMIDLDSFSIVSDVRIACTAVRTAGTYAGRVVGVVPGCPYRMYVSLVLRYVRGACRSPSRAVVPRGCPFTRRKRKAYSCTVLVGLLWTLESDWHWAKRAVGLSEERSSLLCIAYCGCALCIQPVGAGCALRICACVLRIHPFGAQVAGCLRVAYVPR